MKDIPGTEIMDNDEFKEDTLTGIFFYKNTFLSTYIQALYSGVLLRYKRRKVTQKILICVLFMLHIQFFKN